MAESALSQGWYEIAASVGEYLGYTRTTANWDSEQTAKVSEAVNDGTLDFVTAYDWYFLKPSAEIVLEADTSAYQLPDNFGSLVGQFKYDPSLNRASIPYVGDHLFMQHSIAGGAYPAVAKISPLATDGSDGQRWQVEFAPTPSEEVTLSYRFNLLVEFQMNATTPYPFGGMQHSLTHKYACRAAAERLYEDELGKEAAMYEKYLARSIESDKRSRPSFLGYNGDNSDGGGIASRGSYTVQYTGTIIE